MARCVVAIGLAVGAGCMSLSVLIPDDDVASINSSIAGLLELALARRRIFAPAPPPVLCRVAVHARLRVWIMAHRHTLSPPAASPHRTAPQSDRPRASVVIDEDDVTATVLPLVAAMP
uniref:Uncharacterized protein n=1 Tax=Oryza punctata TaxID=4537 RepID=A0A0E0LEQ4_ORYPU